MRKRFGLRMRHFFTSGIGTEVGAGVWVRLRGSEDVWVCGGLPRNFYVGVLGLCGTEHSYPARLKHRMVVQRRKMNAKSVHKTVQEYEKSESICTQKSIIHELNKSLHEKVTDTLVTDTLIHKKSYIEDDYNSPSFSRPSMTVSSTSVHRKLSRVRSTE